MSHLHPHPACSLGGERAGSCSLIGIGAKGKPRHAHLLYSRGLPGSDSL